MEGIGDISVEVVLSMSLTCSRVSPETQVMNLK